jgi:hypothetical protein
MLPQFRIVNYEPIARLAKHFKANDVPYGRILKKRACNQNAG